jgi:hypothetical protein
VAHGTTVLAKGGGGSGIKRWKTPLSWAELLGWCKVFGLGEEGGSSGLRWAKKPERLGPAWEFSQKIQIGLPMPTGRIKEMNRKGHRNYF